MEKNEIRITFDEEEGEVIFSSNIDDILIEERYILAYFTDDKFQTLLYEKARNYYEYYKKKILDED